MVADRMKSITVAVHDGSFHADDVFAVAMLKFLHPSLTVVRTREETLLKKADFRVDVGGDHNPYSGDFDHHQMESVGGRENGIPYASAGLVWKHYGEKITHSTGIRDQIDTKIIQLLDANDNGISLPCDEGEIQPYTLSRLVDSFNPPWDETHQDFDSAFLRAVDFAFEILKNEIRRMRGREKAKDVVLAAVRESDGLPYILLEQYCPWQDVVIPYSEAQCVVFPSPSGDWRVRGVPVKKGSFELRKAFPASWAGLRDEDLVRVTGVADARFCHKERFIAVAGSQEGAESLAMRAVDS